MCGSSYLQVRATLGTPIPKGDPGVFPGLPIHAEIGPGPNFPAIWKPTRRGRITLSSRFPRGERTPPRDSGRRFPSVDLRALDLRRRRRGGTTPSRSLHLCCLAVSPSTSPDLPPPHLLNAYLALLCLAPHPPRSSVTSPCTTHSHPRLPAPAPLPPHRRRPPHPRTAAQRPSFHSASRYRAAVVLPPHRGGELSME